MSKSSAVNHPNKIYALSPSLIFKLKREASSDESVFEQLCIESVTRKWLKSHSIPSWRNPETPVKEELNQSSGRYSILLSDGSRFLVLPVSGAVLSLDMLAAAKCFGALVVKFNKTKATGQIMNCIFIRNVSKNRTSYSSKMRGLESSSKFLHYLAVPKNYISTKVMFCIKLLIIGEPDAPEKGTNGVIPFNQVKSELQEVQND